MRNLDFKFMNLQKAYSCLQEACQAYDGKNDMIRDSIIQRFKISYELSHKVLCEYLKYEGVTLSNAFPRIIYKEAYVNGLLTDEKIWLQLLGDCNATSHIYSEKLADEIAGRICNLYVQAIGELVAQLKGLI